MAKNVGTEKSKGKIYIGTSGWHYKHWSGTFYPSSLNPVSYFDFYKLHFDTVEINNSFYKLPSQDTFHQWKKAAPDSFVFGVKANRYITHMKKLKDPLQPIEKLIKNVDLLENKLGPILFQLPPSWKCNPERMDSFLQHLPGSYRFTFELRDHSWYNQTIYNLLAKFNIAFCIYEMEYHLSPIEITADFVYVRLHGPEKKYQGSYSIAQLEKWAERCKLWTSKGKDVYLYFDNDERGFAAQNALVLKDLVKN